MDTHDAFTILSKLDRQAIQRRLEELDREQHLLRVLLRATRRNQRVTHSDGSEPTQQQDHKK